VVVGGADLDAARYGETPRDENDDAVPVRDSWELALVAAARERDLPYLGICRGAQVLNVAAGGNLIQHVPDEVGTDAHEGHDDVFGSVGVRTVADTRLATLHPESSQVPVYHHQAIGRVGEGLVVNAKSDYGIVEGVEDPALAFCLGVQWHPEQDSRTEIFDAFVAAAGAARARQSTAGR
jgi:putative glutamine amidotransferase